MVTGVKNYPPKKAVCCDSTFSQLYQINPEASGHTDHCASHEITRMQSNMPTPPPFPEALAGE